MESQLFSLSKIFTERVFRIPDYQRGYAWGETQLIDFWNDITQIEDGQNHYTGVIHLESVPAETFQNWHDDLWIIQDKSYEPVYVVDGQQRLTTSIILIEAIVEKLGEQDSLNYTEKRDIVKKFISDSKDGGISKSYIFGYEKDNPSYEYLKTEIFLDNSSKNQRQETIYTENLKNAKKFFQEKIKEFDIAGLEEVFKRVTQSLLFNIFAISDEVDVCVAFETMNNRGKRLSYLELLKNRLIYLSLKLDEPVSERVKLRSTINDCWRAIYHNLGRNKDNPLDDDAFLTAHWVIFNFGRSERSKSKVRQRVNATRYAEIEYSIHDGSPYSSLLREIFVPKNLSAEDNDEKKITLHTIYSYVSSLQAAVEAWYWINNPQDSPFYEETKIWLRRISRMPSRNFSPLLLALFLSDDRGESRVSLLEEIERMIFLSHVSMVRNFYTTELSPTEIAARLFSGESDIGDVLAEFRKVNKAIVESGDFVSLLQSAWSGRGFYTWSPIKYFLFEYDFYLKQKSKTVREKIDWEKFTNEYKEFETVEHIYPREARARYWTDRFPQLTAKQRDALRDSLGNLLPLSRPKNAALSNRPFPEKRDGQPDATVGYRYGCYAENEVAKEDEWTPQKILERGLKMLVFMETRWGLDLGSHKSKKRMLGLDFLK